MAQLQLISGDAYALPYGDREQIAEAVKAFIGRERDTNASVTVSRTVLFTDIVGSTERQAAMGDRAWADVIRRHHAIVREALERWQGVENDTAGDGFYATFDGPARAIRCALDIVSRVGEIGLEIRAGIHTGECEIVDGKRSGLAVTIGARIAALASTGRPRLADCEGLDGRKRILVRRQGRTRVEGSSGRLASLSGRGELGEARAGPAMSLSVGPGLYPRPMNPPQEGIMAATYTFDVFSSLDGFGSASGGDWGGYWGKQGPELLDHRLALYNEEQRMIFGANTYRLFAEMLASSTEESDVRDPWVTRMVNLPAIVVSTTLQGPLDWADATVVNGDAVDVVARFKEESEVPLRSHGSLSMNRALMAAGLVDRIQVTLFPVITGENGSDAIFQGASDFDLELIESRTLDSDIQELT